MSEQLGAMLVRLRQRKDYTQLGVAKRLCTASGVTTVTRHEVSRWERQERIPSAFWLRWLAEVLEAPMAELEVAAGVTRKGARTMAYPDAGSAAADDTRSAAGRRAAPGTTRPAGTTRAPTSGDPLSRVTIEFEHRRTSVRLSATYDDPRRAISAIGAFPSMVEDDAPPGQARAASRAEAGAPEPGVNGGALPAPRQPASLAQQRAPGAAAALAAGKPAVVPVGIRYTSGPGAR